MAEFSLDEAYSGGQSGSTFGLDEAYAATKPKFNVIEPERESNASIALQSTAGMLAGAAGQLSDMFTGILGGIARAPTYVGARVATAGSMPSDILQPSVMPREGVQSPFGNQKLSAQAASIGAEEVLPEEVHAPFRKIAKTLGPEAERLYNENPVGQINTWISEFLTKGTEKGQAKTGVPAEDLMQGVDALMTVAGIKGTKASLLKAIEERNAFKIMTETNRAKKEAAAAQAAVTPVADSAAQVAGREYARQQINSLLDVKTPEQWAAEAKARRKEVRQGFNNPVEDSFYASTDESIYSSEVRAKQNAPAEQLDTSTVYDTAKPAEVNQRPFLPVEDLSPAQQFREGARILQTPPHERTAADLARLRRLREGGSASPELLGLLGVAGVGAATGAALSDDDLRGAGFGAVAGAATALPFMGRGAGIRQVMGQTGAVKGPGGMWHPEAVERLSEPLKNTIATKEQFQTWVKAEAERVGITKDRWSTEEYQKAGGKMFPADEHADRMIRGYLNKHAGTPTDPLKDIEIPFGEGTKRWEELTDNVITGSSSERFPIQGAKPGEIIWEVKEGYNAGELARNEPSSAHRTQAHRALTSYLSHVGDYLRQNVDPAKLPQYDLVRAVKETNKRDIEVAKQMEKASADTTKQLPVYKDYGDGFKWVELKLPEKLTEEQAKGVRAAIPDEAWDSKQGSLGQPGFVALNAEGKPLRNSYTDSIAWGKTPEEAYLAGRLAEEGNQMGHCFPAGTVVNGPNVNLIERIQLGDEVITHTGAVRKVTELFARPYTGNLYTFETKGSLPFSCTPEHPILVARPVVTTKWQARFIANRLPETILPQWIQAKDIQVGDYFLTKGLQQKEINPEFDDLAWLLGLYAGDGDAQGGSGLCFTLSLQDDIERVAQTLTNLGYRPRVTEQENFYRVKAHSVELSTQFKSWFGNSSQEKHLPAFLFNGEANLKQVLAGLCEADGTYYDDRWRVVSTSIALAQQAWLIAVTLGYRPSLKTLKRKTGHGFANASDAWVVEWQEEKGKWHSNIRWNDYYATPVIAISKTVYDGTVYNIEVEEDHSYLVNGLAVHNCVGGYCEGVASGESKIYSLRDAKGKSHVTVEASPERPMDIGAMSRLPETEQTRIAALPLVERKLLQTSGDILQIKGKQNRAPDSKYLPYVQDFVKSGKWGDVGDLRNTGLHQLDPEGVKVGSFLEGQKYATPEELSKAIESGEYQSEPPASTRVNPSRAQQGSIDQQLLIGLGTVGLGGLIGSQLGEDPFVNSLLGAAAGAVLGFTQGGKALGKQAVQNADDLMGRISTRLGNHDAGLALHMRDYERIRLFQTGEKLAHALPLMKAFGKLDEATKAVFTVAARNGDSEAIAKIAKGNPELVAGVREARSLFVELGAEAQRLGRFKKMLTEYFPLMVKDYKGLLGALGKEEQGRLTSLIAAKNAERLGRGLPALSEGEIGKLVNDNLRYSGDKKGNDLSSYRTRKIQEITPELLPFYYDLPDSMFRTIVDTVADLETAKFFGKDAVNVTTPDGRTVLNADASIGNYVGRLVAEGKLKPEAQLEIIDLLKSRFKGGEQGAQTWSRTIRDIGHLSLLGNPGSAAMQLGDPIMALYAQGPRALISGIARSLTGNMKLSSRDYHLADHISQEFYENAMGIKSKKGKIVQTALVAGGAVAGAALADDKISGALAGGAVGFVSAVGMANAVNKVFKTSGFTMVDNFGKNVHLNSAVSNYQRLAETPAGQKKIAEKYEKSFGPWFPELMQDLKQKKITENVRLLAFNELSDYQPITKMEMSKVWLDNPNAGRLALTLKSFMQTQLDIYRRDVYNELRKGNKAKALWNFTALSLTLGVAGATGDAIQDFLMGKDVDITAGGVAENILKTVGFSEYIRDRAGKNPVVTLGGVFVPPIQIMDKILTTDPKAVTAVPLLGKLYYNWELGGREEAELQKEKRAKKKGEDYMLSPRAEQYKEYKKEKAELKRERAER